MRRYLLFNNLLLWLLTLLAVPVAFAGGDLLLPLPRLYAPGDTCSFLLSRPVRLDVLYSDSMTPDVRGELVAIVCGNEGSVDDGSRAVIAFKLVDSIPFASSQDEAYGISITCDSIVIEAVTMTGGYWATQTLWQLSENSQERVSCGRIVDWPAFRIRGYTHDVGRGFIRMDMLKKHIDLLSRYKINTFHWHLTENQAWRLESRIYPQLVADSSAERHPGKYYSIDEARDLVAYAARHGVTVIPEIDMPGHSAAFRRAMGHSMLSDSGLVEMKAIMEEACATFSGTPWMHIGTDEVREPDLGTMDWREFVPQMVSHIHGLGKKVVSWNPGYAYAPGEIDMVHMWSSRGCPIDGVPAIDSRYHYANHFDNFADIVGLYKSNIAGQPVGTDSYAGVIVAFWNDRNLVSEDEIVRQNSFYPAMLAIAERAWMGGGDGYLPQTGAVLQADDKAFFDWERRFIHHRDNHFAGEPIVYYAQKDMKWKITDAFPNRGDLSAVFPPETRDFADSYEFDGKTYPTAYAYGAGVYLRHVWGGLVPGFYADPQPDHTAYAYTYVYSPEDQEVGLRLEFQNYSRSESDLPPQQGKWDYKDSKVWLNGVELNPPLWSGSHKERSTEICLGNENLSSRPPLTVSLKKGWNKVMLKLPVGKFTQDEIRLVKWMFGCVFTTPDGKDSAEGLIYSPDKTLD